MSRKVFHKSHTESLRTNAKCNSSVIEKWYNFALDVNQNLEKGGCGTQMLQADCIDDLMASRGLFFYRTSLWFHRSSMKWAWSIWVLQLPFFRFWFFAPRAKLSNFFDFQGIACHYGRFQSEDFGQKWCFILWKTKQSSEDIEEQGFNIDRSDTMRTLKPSASIPIRSHTRDSLQEDFR